MIGLQRLFKMMDDDGSMTLSMPEFGKACKDFKIGISDENVPILFSLFDTNGDGTLQYEEFINTVRTPMTQARGQVGEKAFNKFSKGSSEVDIDDVKAAFNASRHPDVL